MDCSCTRERRGYATQSHCFADYKFRMYVLDQHSYEKHTLRKSSVHRCISRLTFTYNQCSRHLPPRVPEPQPISSHLPEAPVPNKEPNSPYARQPIFALLLEREIEVPEQVCEDQLHLHQSKVLADTIARAVRELFQHHQHLFTSLPSQNRKRRTHRLNNLPPIPLKQIPFPLLSQPPLRTEIIRQRKVLTTQIRSQNINRH